MLFSMFCRDGAGGVTGSPKGVPQCTVVTKGAIIDFEFLAKKALFVYDLRGNNRKKWFWGHILMKNGPVLMVVTVRISILA